MEEHRDIFRVEPWVGAHAQIQNGTRPRARVNNHQLRPVAPRPAQRGAPDGRCRHLSQQRRAHDLQPIEERVEQHRAGSNCSGFHMIGVTKNAICVMLATIGGMSRNRAPTAPSNTQMASESTNHSAIPGRHSSAIAPGETAKITSTATITTTLCASTSRLRTSTRSMHEQQHAHGADHDLRLCGARRRASRIGRRRTHSTWTKPGTGAEVVRHLHRQFPARRPGRPNAPIITAVDKVEQNGPSNDPRYRNRMSSQPNVRAKRQRVSPSRRSRTASAARCRRERSPRSSSATSRAVMLGALVGAALIARRPIQEPPHRGNPQPRQNNAVTPGRSGLRPEPPQETASPGRGEGAPPLACFASPNGPGRGMTGSSCRRHDRAHGALVDWLHVHSSQFPRGVAGDDAALRLCRRRSLV